MLKLNGGGTQLAMWDGGPVLTNHQKFVITSSSGMKSSRVSNGNDICTSPVPIRDHATLAADTLVASGVMNLARGMSPRANLLAYNFYCDFEEMTAAFANANNHFRLSNHSYGRPVGWAGWHAHINSNGSISFLSFWRDNLGISSTEDYHFGFYNDYSQKVDDIAWWSRYYLSVWAAGNERFFGGLPLSDTREGYFAWTNRVTMTNEAQNLSPTTNTVLIFTTNTPPPYDYKVNNGYDLLTAQTIAKNNLVVGAVHKIPGGYGSPLATNVITSTNRIVSSDGVVTTNIVMTTNVVTTTNVVVNTNVVMSFYSSWGPTDDGRIKPDVVAAGGAGNYRNRPEWDILSTYIDKSPDRMNKSYEHVFGTSYAAPTVAGLLNLLTQLHRWQAGTNTVQPMLASTLRGLAIHTADEAGNYPGPDYRFGWGLFNALSAAKLMNSNHSSGSLAHIKEVRLSNTSITNVFNDNNYIPFPVVAHGSEPLKLTLCWTDPPPEMLPAPALDSTNRMLVNDLDLRLVYESDSGNVTNFPWVLNPLNPTNATTRGINRVDNVEQVVIENPVTNGVYNVHVSVPARLTFPASLMVSTSANLLPMTNQWVSLLVSGNVPQLEPPLEFNHEVLKSNFISLRWASVVGRVYQITSQTNIAAPEKEWLPVSGEVVTTKTNVAVVLAGRESGSFSMVRRVR